LSYGFVRLRKPPVNLTIPLDNIHPRRRYAYLPGNVL
jgi:hypothetical protein